MKFIEVEGKKYVKDVERFMSLSNVKEWHTGDSVELEKWIGLGLNQLFVSENGKVTLYYDSGEGNRFHEVLEKRLTPELFDELCRTFFELIDELNEATLEEKIGEIIVKCWPMMTIFHEISLYPDFVSPEDLERLVRLRQNTESFFYDIEKKRGADSGPKDYVFYKGELFEGTLEDFLEKFN
jgi:hypothetical protein